MNFAENIHLSSRPNQPDSDLGIKKSLVVVPSTDKSIAVADNSASIEFFSAESLLISELANNAKYSSNIYLK